MNRFRIQLLLWLGLLLASGAAVGQIHVDSRSPKVAITPHVNYLVAPRGSYSLQNLRDETQRPPFRRNANQDLSLGFMPGKELWLHFTLVYDHRHDGGAPQLQRYLRIDYPALEAFSLYLIQGERVTRLDLGDALPFAQRPALDTPYVVPITLQGQQPLQVYVHVYGDSAFNLPIDLLDVTALSAERGASKLGHGLYFGLMLAMALISVFFYLATAQRNYLYYALHVVAYGLLQGTVSGLAYQYLWPTASEWNRFADSSMIAIACFFGTWFAREFLQTAQLNRVLHQLMNGVIVAAALGLVGAFLLPHHVIISLLLALTLITAAINIVAGAVALYQGQHAAQYFVLGWFCLLSGSVIHVLLPLGLIPVTGISVNASKFGSALEVIFLAMALADQVNQLGRQRQHDERQIKRQLQVANDELSLALAKLEQSNQLKDQFLTTISHELRTPMNGVLGVIELLQDSSLNDEQHRQLQSAQTAAEEMLTLVETMLNFTELQAGQLKLKADVFEPRQLLHQATQTYRQIAMNKGLRFHFHIERDVPTELLGDGDMLRQMLVQLLDNAVKFTTEGDVCACIGVEIKDGSDDCILMLQIRDTGPGIADAQRQTIFEAFRQLDGDHNRSAGGLGIGLTICRHIVLSMEGTLDLASTPGKGSLFTVLLPFKRIKDRKRAGYDRALPAGHTVLVAEDNPVNQMVLGKLLESLDCRVLIAPNGIKALELLQTQPVDLVMMDCQMPLMDGFECARQIRSSQSRLRDIPIIAVTANAMTGDSEQCLAAGMNDYIKKPINREIVERKLRRWLRIHQH